MIVYIFFKICIEILMYKTCKFLERLYSNNTTILQLK